MLFNDKKMNLEVTLQNGECGSARGQTCMESVSVKYNGDTVKLLYNMQVSDCSLHFPNGFLSVYGNLMFIRTT